MLDELSPRGLTDAARELGVEPFEVVRLLVAAEAVPESLEIDDELLGTIRDLGGIESWWSDASPPEDDNPHRAWLRAALGALLEKEATGDTRVRMDNLWRGLPIETQDAIQQGVTILIEEGQLLSVNAVAGIQVSVEPSSVDTIKGIVDGSGEPESLSALWS